MNRRLLSALAHSPAPPSSGSPAAARRPKPRRSPPPTTRPPHRVPSSVAGRRRYLRVHRLLDRLDPSLAQWPATGCDSRAVVSVDYGRMPTGFGTPEEAVENGAAADIPDGVLTLAPASATSAKGPAQVWVVDPAHQRDPGRGLGLPWPRRLVRRRRDDLQLTSLAVGFPG